MSASLQFSGHSAVKPIIAAPIRSGERSRLKLDCPAPPQLPVQSQEDEKIKGELQGRNQFLTRMLANGHFQGA
jgi:hypothetical protein